MTPHLRILLASHSSEALERLSSALTGSARFACSTKLLAKGESDPLLGVKPAPHVLVMRFDEKHLQELAAMSGKNGNGRPPTIIVGPPDSPELARMAVRSHARDFLVEPVAAADLLAAVERLLDEPGEHETPTSRSEVTVVLGAAGGVGASFIACNLAHALATETGASTLLIDLDVDDAPLASFLDLSPERGLLTAVSEVKLLDEHALAGYVTRHRSGLHLMGAPGDMLLPSKLRDASAFAALMDIVFRRYRHVVVDASHPLDDFSVTALAMARHVLVVVQQSVVQLKQASRLLRLLGVEIGLPDDRIQVVVNRYAKHSAVSLEDVQRSLARDRVLTVPSHYHNVLSSIDGGIPLVEMDRSSGVAKAILELQEEIIGTPHRAHTSLLRRAWPIHSGG